MSQHLVQDYPVENIFMKGEGEWNNNVKEKPEFLTDEDKLTGLL